MAQLGPTNVYGSINITGNANVQTLNNMSIGLSSSTDGTPSVRTIPTIGTDGVMEVGRYIDFHASDSSSDYSVRLDCSSADMLTITSGGLTASTFYGALSGTATNADKLDNLNSTQFIRSDASDTFTGQLTMGTQKSLIASNYGHGVYGVYNATKYQHVWSMGTAYNVSADGSSYGNLYGVSWTHTNIGTGTNQSIANLSHQLQGRINGSLNWALGAGIWTSGNITAYSDRAVKTNLEVIPNALEKIMSINGYTYDRTDFVVDEATGEMPDTRQAGVVAQEVEKVLPEVVSGEDGNKAVAYGNMVSILIEGIKELNKKVETLEAELKTPWYKKLFKCITNRKK